MGDWKPWYRTNAHGLAQYVSEVAGSFLALTFDRYELSLRRDGRLEIAEAIYDALLNQKIMYDTEAYTPQAHHQKIRSPTDILLSYTKRATCLDLSVLFAGLCLANQLIPIVIVLNDHALVAISLTHDLNRWNSPQRPGRIAFQDPVINGDLLRDLVENRALAAIECTGFTRSNVLAKPHDGAPETIGRVFERMGFKRALAAGFEQLIGTRELSFAIDISVARYDWGFDAFTVDMPPSAFSPSPHSHADTYVPAAPLAKTVTAGRRRSQKRSRNRPIDLRLPSWPVRDQGQRGTGVAFAAAAIAEYKISTILQTSPHLSAEFLYWAIKTSSNDPNPDADGTFLRFARNALEERGICEEGLCPYNPIITSMQPHALVSTPSQNAKLNAEANIFRATTYRRSPDVGAKTVLEILQLGRPVAISVPVFQDPVFVSSGGPTNWTTPVGWVYGRVFDPPLRTEIIGSHTICVVGFEPDPDEPWGGHFIFRNSWGTAWGSACPSKDNGRSPEPGYGYISGTYVDRHTWELLDLL
jgi:hypothetical protein